VTPPASGTYDLPSNDADCPGNCRQIPWKAGSDVWNGGSLPNFSSVPCTGLTEGNGTSDNAAAINACITGLGAGQAALIPPGIYYVNGAITVPSNKVLRGSGSVNCSQGTWLSKTFHGDTGSGAACTTFKFGTNGYVTTLGGRSGGSAVALASGYTKGSMSLATSGSPGVAVNDFIIVTEQGDPDLPVSWTGQDGNCTWCGDIDWAAGYFMTQIVQVTSVSGNTIGISRPLYYTFKASLTPYMRKITMGSSQAGVENIKLDGSYADGTTSVPTRTNPFINVNGCAFCWYKSVETYDTPNVAKAYPVLMVYSYANEIRDSYFHYGQSNSGDRNYSIGFLGPNSDHKVENNILRENRTGLSQEAGGSGTVFLYNYIDDGYTPDDLTYLSPPRGNHGAHPYMTLYEGNVLSRFMADNTWGSSSHQVLFRNWLWGDLTGNYIGYDSNDPYWGFTALELSQQQDYYSAVANVLGNTALHTNWSNASVFSTDCGWRSYRSAPRVYALGCDTNDQGTYNPAVRATAILHGNYDFATQGVAFWDGGSNRAFTTSMYYASKPAFLGNVPWPPIGPDVTGLTNPIPAQLRYQSLSPISDFSLAASPSTGTAAQGYSSSYNLTITATGGFTAQVNLSVSGLPAGATATFSPNPATGSSVLSVATSPTTPAGSYPLTITGVNGTLTHTSSISFTVVSNDFALSALPSSQTTVQRGSVNYNLTIMPIGVFAGPVPLSLSGLPAGASGSFSSNPATGSSTLSVTTGPSTPAGSYALTITGTSGLLTHTATVTLVVTDFTLGATPPSQTVTAGQSSSYNVTLTPVNGFSGPVNLSVSGLPTSAIGTFSPNPATGSSTLSLTTGTSTPAGSYLLTITGASGPLSHTATVTLVVTSDFSLSAPPSQTVIAGGSSSYSLPITQLGGFSGQVSFSVSGLPAGATGTFSANPATYFSALSVTTGVNTPAGSYPLTITGTSGTLAHSVTATLVVTDFTLGATPPSQTVTAGGSSSYTLTVTPVGAFSGQVNFSISGLPAGAIGGGFSPNPATGSSTLSLTTSTNTPAGSYTLTITGTSGTLRHNTTVTLVVTSDFTLASTPPSRAVPAGGSSSYNLTITPVGGFSGQVNFSISGLPAGATGTFSPNPATGSSTLSVTTDPTATPAGSYLLTITGTSGTLSHTATPTLVVTDFTVGATPPSQTVTAGGTSSYNLTITSVGGFSGQVNFSVSGLPAGATGTFSPNPATGSSTLSLTTNANTPAGSYTLTITGTSGTLSHNTTVTLVVTSDFTLASTPPTRAVPAGGSSSYNLTITPVGGFSGQVNFSVSGLPAGATGTFSPNPAAGSSTLSITTDPANTPVGSYPLTITGTSGALSHTATATLVVTDFTLGATPPSQTVTAGGTSSYNLTITPVGFSGQISFTVSGLPTGATGTFSPNPATGSSTLSVTTVTSTPAGSYALTVTGSIGTLSHNTTVTLVVTSDFSLSSTPSTQTVTVGGSNSYTLNITPAGGFSGQVNFSVSGLPAGATGTFSPNLATGSSTLSVTTSASTPAGSYSLIITGVSGTLSHTATVTLGVTDFTLDVTPPSRAVTVNGSGNYNLTIAPVSGFSGQVNFSLSGLPAGATGTFSPNPATSSSTLSVTTSTNTPPGSYPITITGVSGSLNHTAAVSLVVTPGLIADLFNNAEAGNPGDLLSVSNLTSSTYGSGGTWTTTNIQKFNVGNSNLGVYADPITVAGATYDGSGSRSWNYDHSVDGQYVKYQIPAGHLKASAGMFLQPGPNATWGTYNFMQLQGVNGMGCALQLFDGATPSNHVLRAQSSNSQFGTQTGVSIPITANQLYWISLQYDSTSGTCSLAVFDPITFVQIGVTSIVPINTNVNLGQAILGSNGHGVTSTAHTLMDDLVIDWTAGIFPVVPR
jgi:hypothetical protein